MKIEYDADRDEEAASIFASISCKSCSRVDGSALLVDNGVEVDPETGYCEACAEAKERDEEPRT